MGRLGGVARRAPVALFCSRRFVIRDAYVVDWRSDVIGARAEPQRPPSQGGFTHETLDTASLDRRFEIRVEPVGGQDAEGYTTTAKLSWRWDSLMTARSATTEDDMVTELFGPSVDAECTPDGELRFRGVGLEAFQILRLPRQLDGDDEDEWPGPQLDDLLGRVRAALHAWMETLDALDGPAGA